MSVAHESGAGVRARIRRWLEYLPTGWGTRLDYDLSDRQDKLLQLVADRIETERARTQEMGVTIAARFKALEGRIDDLERLTDHDETRIEALEIPRPIPTLADLDHLLRRLTVAVGLLAEGEPELSQVHLKWVMGRLEAGEVLDLHKSPATPAGALPIPSDTGPTCEST